MEPKIIMREWIKQDYAANCILRMNLGRYEKITDEENRVKTTERDQKIH